MKTPIVLSPDDHFQTQQKEIRIELLPYIPVLPNRGLLGNQPIPGHNTLDLREYNIKTAHGSNISPLDAFEYMMIEGCLLEFLALLNVSGYQVSCARDVGLRPDGTPVFVDPDVVRNAPKSASDSFGTLLKNLEELSLPRLFDWTNARTPNP